MKETKTYPGADISSDHVPVSIKIHIQHKRIKKQAGAKKLDYATLQEDFNIRDLYTLKVSNRSDVLEDARGQGQVADFPRGHRGSCERSDSTQEKPE